MYVMGLSNELLMINIAQGSLKLWTVKAGSLKKLPYASIFYLEKTGSILTKKIYVQTSKIQMSQFCSPLSNNDEL